MVRGRSRDERGASAAIIAMLMSAILIVSAAFAVDLGQQRVVRRDMQAIADVVALDLARNLNGKKASEYDKPTFDSAKNDSIARNDKALGGKLEPGDLTWGFVKRVDDEWVDVPKNSADVPTAVKVSATSDTPFAFAGIAGVARGGATRTAIASNDDATVCFSIGTKTLALDTSESALSPLLDGILRVNLDAVGYEGIVNLKNVTVPLADLMVELKVGTYDEVATTKISLGDFALAAAKVLEAQGNTAAADLLTAIEIGVEDADFYLGDILALESGAEPTGLNADLNVLDTLTAAIVAANGEHAVEVNIPGVASLTIIEPPQSACGVNVKAFSAQIRATLNPAVPASLVPLGVAGVGVSATLEVGRGEAYLSALGCGPKRADVHVVTGAASLNAKVGAEVNTSRILDLLPGGLLGGVRALVRTVFTLLGINKINIEAFLAASVIKTEGDRVVNFPEPPALPPKIVLPDDGISRTLDLDLSEPIKITSTGLVGALGGLLGDVLGIVNVIVNPLLDAIDNTLLTPLVSQLIGVLGLKLGVAEVSMDGQPACNNVKLVG